MSVETSFLDIERIAINPIQTSLCFGSSRSKFSTQRVVIHFKDGGEHALTFFLHAGQKALALGDVIANEQVTA
jgi:hypothetical protein